MDGLSILVCESFKLQHHLPLSCAHTMADCNAGFWALVSMLKGGDSMTEPFLNLADVTPKSGLAILAMICQIAEHGRRWPIFVNTDLEYSVWTRAPVKRPAAGTAPPSAIGSSTSTQQPMKAGRALRGAVLKDVVATILLQSKRGTNACSSSSMITEQMPPNKGAEQVMLHD